MAKNVTTSKKEVPKRKRKGVFSKTKTSNHKQSKHYRKAYAGQGK